MPYIKKDRRGERPETAGELNYYFTKAIVEYIKFNGESYQTYNDIMGALEGCKLELYIRKVRPYEDKKMVDNGDVYI